MHLNILVQMDSLILQISGKLVSLSRLFSRFCGDHVTRQVDIDPSDLLSFESKVYPEAIP